ncbi:MAG: MFS transporter, partial [Betaproteobacteria bacterium]
MTDTSTAGPLDRPVPTRPYRWVVLAAMSVAVYGSYYAFDYIAPLAPLLSRQLHFSDSQIGLLQAVYSLPNIVAMLVAGVVIDRIGTRKSMALFGVLVFVGLAITATSPQLSVMVMGRLIVGSGAEALALASNVAVARWFWHDELSLGFGLRSSVMRLGSVTAQVSPTWAPGAYTYWQGPLLIGVGFGGFCVVGSALYWALDTRGERRFTLGHTAGEHTIALREVFRFNRSFWLIAALAAHAGRLAADPPRVPAAGLHEPAALRPAGHDGRGVRAGAGRDVAGARLRRGQVEARPGQRHAGHDPADRAGRHQPDH